MNLRDLIDDDHQEHKTAARQRAVEIKRREWPVFVAIALLIVGLWLLSAMVHGPGRG